MFNLGVFSCFIKKRDSFGPTSQAILGLFGHMLYGQAYMCVACLNGRIC